MFLLCNATGYRQGIHRKIFRKFYGLFPETSQKENAGIVLCGDNPLNGKDFPGAKWFICNMTNTNHIKNVPKEKMISLEGETEFLKTIFSTAHHTLHLLLSLVRPLTRSENPGVSLVGKSVGIIGYGRVGKQMVCLYKALGMETYAYDIDDYNPPYNSIRNLDYNHDFYSIHVSVKPKDKPVLDKKFFKNVKDGVYIINTSRQSVIDYDALKKYEKKIKGIASDFFVPVVFFHYVPAAITKHVGGWTEEDLIATGDFCFKKFTEKICI